jgi:hypothetical protein
MADIVDVKSLFSGKRYEVFHLTFQGDAAAVVGENGATKMDISNFTDPVGNICTYTAIDRIEFSVWGFAYVLFTWDHTADDEIAIMQGQGIMDWSKVGGNVDPRTAGGTGDILSFTAPAAPVNSGYDITMYVRPKA